MDSFCIRLLSFYERGSEGKPGRWPHSDLAPEYMAGAGFRLQGSQATEGDSVVCDWCKLQAWKWESKDDPFEQHVNTARACEYVNSEMFQQHREVFLKKQATEKSLDDQPMLSPPATPVKTKYKPRRRMVISPIFTVIDINPSESATLAALKPHDDGAKPVEIAVSAGDIKFVIQVMGNIERGSKRLRLE
ncbi:hypothetical protein CCHL11_10088 [Colletotrichum chlorophyti]|uniref:Uncharacterized protein n=1 Tax=Colletotrichum chlorophyti TaxID=708187 RepID=A0A1Q8RNY3_9PEZI|nr:hypothetical protein CCHL11_10088 [Colletotrichum chlorophyti]